LYCRGGASSIGGEQSGAESHLEVKDWKDGTVHDLRKSFATRAASAGVPMHELHKHLGHSNISTTAEFYVGMADEAADRLRAVFDPPKIAAG
jgi:integrase